MSKKINPKEKAEIEKQRDSLVVKANQLVQKARYDFNLQEMKIMSYCFSMIKPNDGPDTSYIFSIRDYCKVCGIDYDNGANYQKVREGLLSIINKSFWLMEPDGSEVTVHWLDKARINRGSGKIAIRFDEDLKKYIFGLFKNFTQYELLCVLPMKSQFSFRLYELLKSQAFKHSYHYDIDDLKKILMAENYSNFKDFRKKVLEAAIKEINEYTDLHVEWEPETKGRKVTGITFYIMQLDVIRYGTNRQKARAELDHQMTIFDFLPEERGKGET